MSGQRYQCEDCGTEKRLEDRGVRAKRACPTCEDITTWEQQVWISMSGSESRKKYHTNEDCHNLPDEHRQKTLSLIEPMFEECAFCAGTAKTPRGDFSYQDALKEAANDA